MDLSPILLLFLIFAVLLHFLGKAFRVSGGRIAYQARPDFLSPAERSFFGVLEQILPVGFRVFAKPRLADVLEVSKGVSRRSRVGLFNRIAQKHVDFVLLDAATMRVVAGIELDDSSHRRASAKVSDSFKDKAFAAASIPLLRVRAARSYNVQELRSMLEKQFSEKRSGQV